MSDPEASVSVLDLNSVKSEVTELLESARTEAANILAEARKEADRLQQRSEATVSTTTTYRHHHSAKIVLQLDLDAPQGLDHFQTWHHLLEASLQMNGITDSAQRYYYASINLGKSAAYYLTKHFPSVPSEEPYEQLIKLFHHYFGDQQSPNVRLSELFAIQQSPNESLDDFQARLVSLMRNCAITDKTDSATLYNTVATHLFARGLRNRDARQRVLESESVDFRAAVRSAKSVTMAAQLQGTDSAKASSSAYATTIASGDSRCGNCGKGHNRLSRCTARNARCNNCGKIGHFAAVCRSRTACSTCGKQGHEAQVCRSQRRHSQESGHSCNRKNSHRATGKSHSKQFRLNASHWLGDDSNSSASCSVSQTTPFENDAKFVLPMALIRVNGNPVRLRPDSASMVTILPRSQLPSGVRLKPASSCISPLNIFRIKPAGVFDATLEFGDRKVSEQVVVVDHRKAPSLLSERASLALSCLVPGSQATVHSVSAEKPGAVQQQIAQIPDLNT